MGQERNFCFLKKRTKKKSFLENFNIFENNIISCQAAKVIVVVVVVEVVVA
jgi:hypothetical protein